jgi:hypothetical protein
MTTVIHLGPLLKERKPPLLNLLKELEHLQDLTVLLKVILGLLVIEH